MMKKILTDCDGVLLDWETAFHDWMVNKGYSKVVHDTYNIDIAYAIPKTEKRDLVREFNESAWMVDLPVLRDAEEGFARLAMAGYRFDCITSLSTDPHAKTLRAINLNRHFGSDAFDELVCLDTGADKDDALEKYADTGLWWIEDKPENCDTGLKFGLRPILIDHPHNRWYDNPNVVRVRTWKELADIVLGE
jgi:FMN phosphatase YigB (HAD superfamily)